MPYETDVGIEIFMIYMTRTYEDSDNKSFLDKDTCYEKESVSGDRNLIISLTFNSTTTTTTQEYRYDEAEEDS